MKKEKILVVVKTYPNISKQYRELVCTAGIKEDGTWVRMYPIPFRFLTDDQRFKKYQWINAELQRNTSDPRPESFKINASNIETLGTIETKNEWSYRKDIILKSPVYEDMEKLIKYSKENKLSIALFKPKKVHKVEFISNGNEDWTDKEKKFYRRANSSLFEDTEVPLMPKIPYDFKLEFEDVNGKRSKMIILDWEISQLFLTMKKKRGSSRLACADVEQKIEELKNRDLHFILGTTRQFHGWASNPFTIIGLFYPPKTNKYIPSLFS